MRLSLAASLSLAIASHAGVNDRGGVVPKDASGATLNLGFETGTLAGWSPEGDAFESQPIKGDVVSARRADMASDHVGDYWIGGFERYGDARTGTLTSIAFKVTHPYASFLVSGGPNTETRVELLDASNKAFFSIIGYESENLRPIVVDLEDRIGDEIRVRIVDEHTGHWGHVNYDDFRFHASRPEFDNALDAEELIEDAPPPIDVVLHAGLEPQAAAEAATLPEGFEMHVFAAEPDVRQPIAMTIDARGRLWIAEGYTYPRRRPEGEGIDRILIFEDTDGDHQFDQRKVFMEGLNLVSGLEVGFGGVWVGAAPYFMFIPDRDGDDTPDAEPTILLDGWDPIRDTHETLNTFTWGPDGWLYGCHGVFCPSHVGKPGTPQEERQRVDAAIWRYHPIRHEFEVFAEGTSNPWGVDFDQYGQCVIEACVIPHFWHIIQGARYQRQGGQHYSASIEEMKRNRDYLPENAPAYLNPFIYEDIKTHGDHLHWLGNQGPHAGNNRSDAAGGGHAHAGLMIYQGASWPKKYHNQAFMNNIHGQRLNVDALEPNGSSYKGVHQPDFLNFNDRWSQVLNMRYDQNGSVYIIDWYDKNQCHHGRVDGHDRGNGRIYKVVYNDEKWTSVNLNERSDLELATLQTHSNEWMAEQSRRILQHRSHQSSVDASAIDRLREILDAAPDVHALRALWTLHVIHGANHEERLHDALEHSSEYIRGYAIQLLFEDKQPTEADLQALRRLARNDNSPLVRRYIASALQRTPVSKRVPVLSELLQRAEDSGDHNLPLLYWFALEPVVGEHPEVGLDLLKSCQIPKLREFIARRLLATKS